MLNYDKKKTGFLLFSGGKGSALAAYLLRKNGYDNVKLLFTDTNSEDKDLYRFLNQCVEYFGYELIRDSDGRDIWQVFKDEKLMGNQRKDPCSRILKRERSKKFREKQDPGKCYFAFGIDIWEKHRIDKLATYWEPYKVVSPLIDAEIYDTDELWKSFLEESKIKEPYLYSIGMTHNNCGGFCVKAGLAHYRNLLEKDRERYLAFEEKELEVHAHIGKTFPFLRRQKNGVRYYMTLKEYRELLERDDNLENDSISDNEPNQHSCTNCN